MANSARCGPPPPGYEQAARDRLGRKVRAYIALRGWREPLDTQQAFKAARAQGYDATRSTFNNCRDSGAVRPRHESRWLVWTVADIVDFAMELDRRRRWLPGHHAAKKSAAELDAEARQRDEAFVLSERAAAEVDGLTAAEILAAVAAEDQPDMRAAIAEHFPIRLCGEGGRMSPIREAALAALVDCDDAEYRRSLAAELGLTCGLGGGGYIAAGSVE